MRKIEQVLTKKKRSILRQNKIPEAVFIERLNNGWNMKAALNTPVSSNQ